MLAIYSRISKRKEDGKDVSIEVQQGHGTKFATTNNFPYKLYTDVGKTGTKSEIEARPAFAEMYKAIEDGLITAVYCYDQSRIERNSTIWNLFVHATLKHNCTYYPDGKAFDLDDPNNRFISGILSLSNELYASLTGKKVKDAINRNALKGKAHGMTAYGYEKDDKGYLKVNSTEAKIIKRMYRLSLGGNGAYTIANILNGEGIPTKFNRYDGSIKRKDDYTGLVKEFAKDNVKWRGNVIHDMIRNPIYKGQRQWNDETIAVPPIVDEATWDKVNRSLQQHKAGKRAEYHYLLNGILHCGQCGGEIRGKKRLKGHDEAYKCVNKSSYQRKKCPDSRGISILKLEAAIVKLLFLDPAFKRHLSEVSKSNPEEITTLEKQLEKNTTQRDKIQKNIDRIYHLLTTDNFSNDERLAAELKKMKRTLSEVQDNIEALQLRIVESRQNKYQALIKRANKSLVENADFDSIKEIIHALIKRITIHHMKQDKGGVFVVTLLFAGTPYPTKITTNWQASDWLYGYYLGTHGIKENKIDKERKIIITPDDYILFD